MVFGNRSSVDVRWLEETLKVVRKAASHRPMGIAAGLSKEDSDRIDELILAQKETDRKRREMAMEIVSNQKLTTLEEAKQFAQNWIETAAQHSSNEDYWRTRARAAEKLLGISTSE